MDLSSRLILSELSFKHKRIFLIVLISYPMAAVMVAIAFSGGRRAEAAEELRKSGERGSGRRRREERRVSEGRYADFELSDEGGVKGLS